MVSLQATTAVALILGFAALASGALMYWLRDGIRAGAPPSRRYLAWEHSFIMAAVVLTAVGLVLLAGRRGRGKASRTAVRVLIRVRSEVGGQ